MHSVRSRGRRHRKRRLVRELGGSRQGNRHPWWFSPDDRDWLCSPDRSRRCVSLHMLVTAAEFLLGPRWPTFALVTTVGPNRVLPDRPRVNLAALRTVKLLRHGSNAGHSSGVPGVDARRATPPDPRLAHWGLAGCLQPDPSHPALVTREDPGVEPCRFCQPFLPD